MDFWDAVRQQVTELRHAKTADDVLRILSRERNPYGADTGSGEGFFAGDSDDMLETLLDAGWHTTWVEAGYNFKIQAPNGDILHYCEGDIDRVQL